MNVHANFVDGLMWPTSCYSTRIEALYVTAAAHVTARAAATEDSHVTAPWIELIENEDIGEERERVYQDNLKTFEELKVEWSHFFLEDTDTLVVGEKIAQGGQAEIFEAHWPDWESGMFDFNGVVLKVFKEYCLLRELRMHWPIEFIRYAELANAEGRSWHPRLCHIFGGLLLKDGRFAFAMERYWGDLRNLIDLRIRHNRNQRPPFTAMVGKRIMSEIAEGMLQLHELGIIHRDLKPSNIFIKASDNVQDDQKKSNTLIKALHDNVHADTEASTIHVRPFVEDWESYIENDSFSCVVADFENSLAVTGTGFWRAPEILARIRNRERVEASLFSEKSDVYSYSMTCYEILTGIIPFQMMSNVDYDYAINGGRPHLPETIDPAIKSLLSSCWHPDPSQRPTFVEICEELNIMIGRNLEIIPSEPNLEIIPSEPNLEFILLEPHADNKRNSELILSEVQPDNEGNPESIPSKAQPDNEGNPELISLEAHPNNEGNPESIPSKAQPDDQRNVKLIPSDDQRNVKLIPSEPQLDNEGNLEFLIELLMFVEPISNYLASYTDLGGHLLDSITQWIQIDLGSFGEQRRQVPACSTRRVSSRDLKSVQFLGQGFSGFIYETAWLTWYGRERLGRFARKDFPRAESMVFEKETARLINLDHPNLVKIFCWTVDRLGCSLVMEFVNTDLESVVEKRKDAQKKNPLRLDKLDKPIHGTPSPFKLGEAIYIMLHITRAMEYLHSKGVGHGDLRPNNILVDLEADQKIVKVVDFGLLESKKRSTLVSKRAQFVRTLEWKAPETWKDIPTSLIDSPDEYLWEEMDTFQRDGIVSTADELADVYSFAVTCTYIMGGTILYPKSNLGQLQQLISSGTLRPEIPSLCPRPLRELIESSWNSDPEERPRFSYLRMKLEEYSLQVEDAKVRVQGRKRERAKRMQTARMKGTVSDFVTITNTLLSKTMYYESMFIPFAFE